MRFMSAISAYRYVAFPKKTRLNSMGEMVIVDEGYSCQFQRGVATQREKEIGKQRLHFRGIPMNMDRTPYDVTQRISIFDTAWVQDPQLRARVEKRLLESSDFGLQDGYILVEEEKLAPPWASYDELVTGAGRNVKYVAGKNLDLAAETGTPIDYLIEYERQNRNDERIIAAYEEAKKAPNEPAEELVSA